MKYKILKKSRIGILIFVLPLCGLWLMGQGAYIHAKALLAQVLLETAWTRTIHGKKEVRPWPWADTWPVSRLSVPRLGINRIVLAGANGSALAFGPGHLFDSAKPGDPGNIVIAGHRDTHFRFLQNLHNGDIVELQSASGNISLYRILAIKIVMENNTALMDAEAGPYLTLITCYPFNAIRTGGPLRYVVIAGRMVRAQESSQTDLTI